MSRDGLSATGVDPQREIDSLQAEIRRLDSRIDGREIARLRSRMSYWRRKKFQIRREAG